VLLAACLIDPGTRVNFSVINIDMSDTLALSIIAAVVLGYMHTAHNNLAANVQTTGRPSQAREVDLSRWRHDGSQPTMWFRGNGASFVDETSQKVELLLS